MKKLLVLVLAAAMLLTLCACGSKETPINASKLADELLAGITFESEMTAISEEQIGFMMAEMPVKFTAAGYGATGSTAEEIIVVKCESNDDATLVENSVAAHLKELTDQANKYDPAAVARIEGAAVSNANNCVVLVIADDTSAVSGIIEAHKG